MSTPLFPRDEENRESFDPVSGVWNGATGNTIHYLSMVAIVAIVAAAGLFSGDALKGMPLLSRKVQAPKSLEQTRTVLIINGDRDAMAVAFRHDFHKAMLGGEKSCARCHHLDRPGDRDTACNKCHEDQNLETPIFNHSFHVDKNGGNKACGKCHPDKNAPRWETTARPCQDCHTEDMRMAKSAAGQQFNHNAPSYVNAMHGMCIECHRQMKLSHKTKRALEECGTCHGEKRANRPI